MKRRKLAPKVLSHHCGELVKALDALGRPFTITEAKELADRVMNGHHLGAARLLARVINDDWRCVYVKDGRFYKRKPR